MTQIILLRYTKTLTLKYPPNTKIWLVVQFWYPWVGRYTISDVDCWYHAIHLYVSPTLVSTQTTTIKSPILICVGNGNPECGSWCALHYTLTCFVILPPKKPLRKSITSTWLSRSYKTEGPSKFVIVHLVEALKLFHKQIVHQFVILSKSKLEIDSRILDSPHSKVDVCNLHTFLSAPTSRICNTQLVQDIQQIQFMLEAICLKFLELMWISYRLSKSWRFSLRIKWSYIRFPQLC
jgi:hypothetical protein